MWLRQMRAGHPLYGNAVTQTLSFSDSAISAVGLLGHHSRKTGLSKLILASQCLGPEAMPSLIHSPMAWFFNCKRAGEE